jgi:hypothetical protein
MAQLILVTLLAFTQFLGTSQNAPAVRIEGTVVAYSPFARLTILVGPPQPADNIKRFHEDFLIRLDKELQGLKKGQLVRLEYRDDTGTKQERPKDLFTQNATGLSSSPEMTRARANLRSFFTTRLTRRLSPTCNLLIGPNR